MVYTGYIYTANKVVYSCHVKPCVSYNCNEALVSELQDTFMQIRRNNIADENYIYDVCISNSLIFAFILFRKSLSQAVRKFRMRNKLVKSKLRIYLHPASATFVCYFSDAVFFIGIMILVLMLGHDNCAPRNTHAMPSGG